MNTIALGVSTDTLIAVAALVIIVCGIVWLIKAL